MEIGLDKPLDRRVNFIPEHLAICSLVDFHTLDNGVLEDQHRRLMRQQAH